MLFIRDFLYKIKIYTSSNKVILQKKKKEREREMSSRDIFYT